MLTYVLRQDGHGLVHEGFLQARRCGNMREAEVVCLAPSLDAPKGHPAIWNKLLAHFVHVAGASNIERIYADAPDQPLLVNTFAAVGFEPFTRQTVWRCFEPDLALHRREIVLLARPRSAVDDWDLRRLYRMSTPEQVRMAEGFDNGGEAAIPSQENLSSEQNVLYVVREGGDLIGAFAMTHSAHGVWLQIWGDSLEPTMRTMRTLLEQALSVMTLNRWRGPVYFAVSDYQRGVSAALEEFGFAPFCDRVRMVKHMVKWVRESVFSAAPLVETAGEIVPTTYAPPKAVASSARSSTHGHSSRGHIKS
ncbi:MAG: hypothetical protein NZ553_11325 [Caldilinea sp.]|nr:hypothetical protein [Caldilinea sp.]MDW8441056.1 hypothetical protein [Caldilineaceae bacterium]